MSDFIRIKIEGIDSELNVVSVSGCEKLSNDYSFSLVLKTPITEPLSGELCLDKTISLAYDEYQLDNQVGIITSLQHVITSDPHYLQYNVECHSPLHCLNSIIRSNVFIDCTPLDIIAEILNEYLQVDFHISCIDSLPKKSFIHQYNETDYAFISRLCEHWGIYYYFDPEQSNKLIFADDNSYPISEKTFRFLEKPNQHQRIDSVTSLNIQENPVIDHIVVEGRNPEQDSQIITGEHGIENPNKPPLKLSGIGIDNEDEALLIAQRRFEQQQCHKKVYLGTSTSLGIKPGFVINIQVSEHQPCIALLILSVDYQANNLAVSNSGHLDVFTLNFSAIPADTVFRPDLSSPIPTAISSTARIYSCLDDITLAHRDGLGRYQVVFDYIHTHKVSHWIRKTQSAAKDSHLDVPLLPGTEVQIAYLGGNPDLPYISCALENSQSIKIPSTHETPYTASFDTCGMLNVKAGRSYKSVVIAPMDKQAANNPPPPPKIIITPSITATPSEYYQLDNNGNIISADKKLSLNNPDYNLTASEGQVYKIQDTVSFYLGDNPTYYFGQQYREVHIKKPNEKSVPSDESFSFSSDHLLDQDYKSVNADSSLPLERQVGMVRKIFGNRYNYHDGNIVTVRKGDGEPHKTFNYGARYVEHIAAATVKSTNSIEKDFPDDKKPTIDDYIVRNHLKQYKINHDDTITVQVGNSYVKRTGDTERIQDGNSKVSITGTSRNKIIDITGNSTKDITAGSIESTLTASVISKTVNGVKRSTTNGSDTSSVSGDKHSVVGGNKTSVIMGGKAAAELGSSNKFIGGLKTEMVAGATIKCALLPEFCIAPVTMKKRELDIKKAGIMIEDAKATVAAARIVLSMAGLTIIG